MSRWNRYAGYLLAGGLLVGVISYMGAQALTASETTLALAGEGEDRPDRPMRHKLGRGLHGAIRGELVVPGEEEGSFRTIRIDRGTIRSIDGSTVVIAEEDGTEVEVAISDETEIFRNGERSELSDLVAGDHVAAHRVDEGDGFVTEHLRVISADRWAEREERRSELMDRRADRLERRAELLRERAA